ncbi:MAG: ABC transporter permease [Flavobacterium sp.]|nr:MAG: ABC transporter permease [Flavobacterium sp.]
MSRSLENKDFKDFLPHRGVMLMVKDLLKIDNESVTSGLPIIENCIFVENNYLTASGLIENAAQTSTAIVGQGFFLEDDLTGESNKLMGYISAIKKVEIFNLPKVGEYITTRASLISRFDTDSICICHIKCSTFIENKLIVNCTFNFLIHEV